MTATAADPAGTRGTTEPLLEISGLTVTTDDGATTIVDGVDLELRAGEVLCIVGESGSGKSVTMLAASGLLAPGLRVASGSVRYRGTELLGLSEKRMRALRGKDLGMVFQDPMTALNPVKRVGNQIQRAVELHQDVTRHQARERTVELLERVGITEPRQKFRSYPHEWSGGMRQRAVIAMAMANDPRVLIADEPTTALDVTVQAQVMDVLADARASTGAAMVMITHDLGLVAEVADRVAIMYSGRIVEQGTVHDVFERPAHPYTRALLGSLLTAAGAGGRAVAIPGSPPSPARRPGGCAFAPRCTNPAKSASCTGDVPRLLAIAPTARVACHHALVGAGDRS